MCPENTGAVFNVFRGGAKGDIAIQEGEKISGLLYSQRRRLCERKTKRAVKIHE